MQGEQSPEEVTETNVQETQAEAAAMVDESATVDGEETSDGDEVDECFDESEEEA